MDALEVTKKRIVHEKLPVLAKLGAILTTIEDARTLKELDELCLRMRYGGWGFAVKNEWCAMWKPGYGWREIKAPVEIEGGDGVVGPFPRREDARIWIRATDCQGMTVASSSIHNRLMASNNRNGRYVMATASLPTRNR